MPESVHVFTPGSTITRVASAAILGGQLVVVTGPGQVGPSTVATHSWVGTAAFDAAAGDQVTILCGGVQSGTAFAAITAGNTVEPAAAGQVAAHTNGTNDVNIIGIALNSATAGQPVEVDAVR
jgi:predicted RecA/RadA family phage recombinase